MNEHEKLQPDTDGQAAESSGDTGLNTPVDETSDTAPVTSVGATTEDIGGGEPTAVEALPVLPLKNTVVFPYTFSPVAVGRPMSLAAAEAAMNSEEKTVLLLTQRDPAVEAPTEADLYRIGTRAVIKRMSRGDDVMHLLAQGIERVRVVELQEQDGYLVAQVEPVPVGDDDSTERDALRGAVREQINELLALAHPDRATELGAVIDTATSAMHFVFMLGSLLEIDYQKEQEILEAETPTHGLRLLHEVLQHELQVQRLRQEITSKARSELSREQREFLLRRQLDAIHAELGDEDPDSAELEELRRLLDEAELPEQVRSEVDRELRRLDRLPPTSPDHQVTRTYLELLAELPWNQSTEDHLDLEHARQVLDEDHYELREIKDRIIEHLAVMKLKPDAESPILCFVGPPGVGKTSLGKSIARALGRKFERISLGGLHDEAELRGHRRTYIGAMPGRVIQAIHRAGVTNPVLMLDEVDKLGHDFRGDPAAALLEILDPAQNDTFRDNYLNLPFDLSKVFFICTANTLDTIPRPLLDRMEIVRLSGYTDEEKMEIARRYLIPRQLEKNGIDPQLLSIPAETLHAVISRYTREAGVRQLERAIGRLCRKVAVRVAQANTDPVTIRVDDLPDMLGREVHRPEQSLRELPAGVATGLAWTESGGDILYVEAALLPNGSGIRTTGQLGEVMRESAEAALSYVWAHAEELGIDPHVFRKSGFHIHVPAGAIPKDGPSAGVAMVTALTSLLTQTPARPDTAMTGEITLSGRVLPIGGVKEKVLAARAAGIRRVVLPKANESDLRDLPEAVREELEFRLAETIDEALAETIGSPRAADKPIVV